MAKKASTYPASEWAQSFKARKMSEQMALRLCRKGLVEGATKADPNYLGKWMVPVGSKDPRRVKGTPDPRHPVGAPKKAVKP